MWAGARAGVVAGNDQSHRQFQCASFALLLGVSKHVSALHEWNLGFFQLSCYSHCFSNKLRGLIFLVLEHRPGVPNKWLKLLTPQGRSIFLSPSHLPTRCPQPHTYNWLCCPLPSRELKHRSGFQTRYPGCLVPSPAPQVNEPAMLPDNPH